MKRKPELDGLRGIAVCAVLAWHFLGVPSRQTALEFLHAITIFGRTGVDLFFVLSGFLITGILVDFRQSRNLLPVFFARRALRILPPYILLIAVYWAIFLVFGPTSVANERVAPAWQQVIAQTTLAWNWLIAIYDQQIARGFDVTWSVAIEEWFYILLPAVVLAVPPKRLALVLALIAIVSICARAAVHLIEPSWRYAPYVLLPFRLDGLCFGGLLALAYRSATATAALTRRLPQITAVAVCMLLSIPFVVAAVAPTLRSSMYLWGHVYLNVAFALGLAAVVLRSQVLWLRNPLLVWFGLRSYSIYLFHPLILAATFGLAGREARYNAVVDAGLVLAAFGATLVVCAALFRTVERPALSFGHRRFQYVAGPWPARERQYNSHAPNNVEPLHQQSSS